MFYPFLETINELFDFIFFKVKYIPNMGLEFRTLRARVACSANLASQLPLNELYQTHVHVPSFVKSLLDSCSIIRPT